MRGEVFHFFQQASYKVSTVSNSFFFDGNSGFLAGKACLLVVQSRNNIRKPLHPGSRPLALRKSHFHGILVAEQALSQACG